MVRLGSTPVLDFGTFSVKAGFAGEPYPLLVFTHESFHLHPWPIVRGKIEDWDKFEEMMSVIWVKLRVDSYEEEVIIIENLGTTEEEHRRMEVLMFERFKVRYLTFLSAPLCVCYAAGIKTGLIVDFGHGVTRLSVVIENEAREQLTVPIGGQDVDEDLADRLNLAYPRLKLTNHIRLIKERHCFASLDPRTEAVAEAGLMKCLNRTYELPDETPLVINRERAMCIERLFTAVKYSDSRTTIAELMKQLINSYPDSTSQLSQNIVICGATTECTNFNYRLLSELYKSKAASVVRIFCPPERSFTCWVGASIIYFDNDYVDKGMSFNEYNLKYLQTEQ